MCQNTPGAEGLIPRCAKYLFDEVEKRKSETEFNVEIQFPQLYRTETNDLLSESGNQRFQVHFDNATGVTLPGASSHKVTSAAELMHLFEEGYKKRVTVATAMNPESSRGHAALLVWIHSRSTAQGNCEQRLGKITFVDLAGYERFSKTGISGADPIRKDEAKTINASLLALGHVVTSLSNGDKHIPWRNATLTRLLQDSIGGRSRTALLLTASPSSDHLYETQNTLQLGERAMSVKVQSKAKVIVDWEKHAKRLEAMLEEKQKRVEELQQQLADCAAAESEMILRQQKDIDALKDKHAEALAELAEEGADDMRLQTLRHQQEVEAELLYSAQAEERAYQEEQLEEEEMANNTAEESSTSAAAAAAATATDGGHEEPTTNASFDGESSFSGKNKDELIADLRRQVRLYRMKLMVPEKYRAAAEEVEHEALSGTMAAHTSAAMDGMAGTMHRDGASFVPVAEFEAMRTMLEGEIDNRDALIAQQLDLQSFASPPSDVSSEKPQQQQQQQQQKKTVDEAGKYVASLHRRISDLTDRLDAEKKRKPPQEQEQQQPSNSSSSNNTANQDEAAGNNNSSSSSARVQELEAQLSTLQQAAAASSTQLSDIALTSFSSAALDSKQATAAAALDLIAQHLSGGAALCCKFNDEVQFLQTELETNKVEMQMALEGQNESLMEAIQNARSEAQRDFRVQKLSWEEETEGRANTARQEGAAEARQAFEDQELMQQAEFAKLRRTLFDRDEEIAALQSAVAAAEEEAAAAHKRADDAGGNKKDESQQQQPTKQPDSPVSKKPSPPKPTPKQPSSTAIEFDEIDSVLMPMLKSKTQLLDDITDVLASTANTGFDSTFDHIPDIPLCSARGGASTLDPHASLANFVKAVQQSRAAAGAALDDAENAAAARNDSFDEGGFASSASPPPLAKPAAGVPRLALGGIGAAAAAAANKSGSDAPLSPAPLTTGRRMGGGGGGLPANLPAVLLRIIKRMRDNSSEAEAKWMRCVVALSKISKSVSVLAQQQQQQQQAQPQQQQQQRVAKIAADVMNFVKAGLTSDAESGARKLQMQTQQRGLSEAEQARRSLADAYSIQRPVVAGEPVLAEQQALQSVLKSHQEQLARADEEMVSLAVEVARSKLALRFERQIMLALGETDEEGEARRTIVDFEAIAREQAGEAAAQQQEEQEQQQQQQQQSEPSLRAQKQELSYYKLKAAMLEQKMRTQLAELAKAQQQQQQLQPLPSSSSSSSHANLAATATGGGMKTLAMKEQELQREIHAASASVVSDMELVTSCRESELRVLSSRLERVERELSAANSNIKSSNNNKSGGGGGSGVNASAENVFYHVLRNLRKENSILHSVIRERGLQLRKFAMTLMRHGLLPPAFDTNKLAGDVHSELRLAFAERDEEIFLKEQALNMRSTQVIVLEESLTALMDQLNKADMTPCRAPSKFSVELQREREEMRGKLDVKGKKRQELKAKLERVKTELEKVTERMAQHKQEQETGKAAAAGGGGGPISTHAQSAAGAAGDALLVLRLQRDHLTHNRDISEVQLGALESELALLQQALMSSSSTMAIESGIENRDAVENASVFQKIFGFGKK